jgi:hypothetical protein
MVGMAGAESSPGTPSVTTIATMPKAPPATSVRLHPSNTIQLRRCEFTRPSWRESSRARMFREGVICDGCC